MGKDKQKGDQKNKTAKQGFSLPKESHTVIASTQGNTLRVTIASDRELEILGMIADAKAEVAADKAREPAKRSQIISLLDSARTSVKSMEQDWRSLPSNEQGNPKQWQERRLAQIVNLLVMLGAQDIKAFSDFKGKPLQKRYLPSGFSVREKLYLRGSGWAGARASVVTVSRQALLQDINLIVGARVTNPAIADAAWKGLVARLQAPYGATKDNVAMQHVHATQYDVDHIDVLSDHWEKSGHNLDDKSRWALSGSGKLRYITQRENLARQSGSYHGWVGKDFVSQFAQGGQVNAKQIDGQPFLDAPGGKPI